MHHAEFNAHFSHPLPRNALRKFVKKIPKVVQPVTCQVCNMQFGSVNNIRSHITGNKHKKNLEKLQDSITPKVAEIPDGAVAVHRTGRKRLEKPVPCELCKLQLTSINEFRSHAAGKKHKMNLEMLQDSTTPKLAEPPNGAVGESTEAAAAVTDGMIPAVEPMENKSPAATLEDLEAGAPEGEPKICTVSNVVKKIPNVVQPVTCEVCKRKFTSVNAIRDHERAKHKKNLEKLPDSITPILAESPNGTVGASTEAAAAAVTDGVIPAVRPRKRTGPAATREDLEAKKRRVIEQGVA
jgi:ribosomal protein L34E